MNDLNSRLLKVCFSNVSVIQIPTVNLNFQKRQLILRFQSELPILGWTCNNRPGRPWWRGIKSEGQRPGTNQWGRTSEERPRWSQDWGRTSQERLRWSQDWGRTSEDRPHWSQDGPRWSQNGGSKSENKLYRGFQRSEGHSSNTQIKPGNLEVKQNSNAARIQIPDTHIPDKLEYHTY